MRTTRRRFLRATAAAAAYRGTSSASMQAAGTTPGNSLQAFEIAGRHRIVRDQPTPAFLEGMLLGNGDIGVAVTLRPDAMGLHLGKEDSWDIRVSEEHYRHVVPFPELLKLWERAGNEAKRQGKPDMLFLERNIPFFREYTDKVESSYLKPWPRPWPCGIVWIHWDPRTVRVVRQTLDISSGRYVADLRYDDPRGGSKNVQLHCLVNWTTGHVGAWSDGPAPVLAVSYYPNIDEAAQLPPPEITSGSGRGPSEFSCYQHFPAVAPTADAPNPLRSGQDRNFALFARLAGSWDLEAAGEKDSPQVHFRRATEAPFRLDVTLFTPRDHPDNVAYAEKEARRLSAMPAGQLAEETENSWRQFWSRSAVEFEDRELERIWYHNQYLLACCLREGKVAPGLFGNWTSGKIGTAWHGDYHMNYNTQQVFWGVFSSNHADQHLPYVELAEHLLPLAESYAREKFRLPGAFFPHSAYPVPSKTIAYPAPPWGYEVCETPWTVQSLWWHYLYTQDETLLRRVYPLLRAAARFLAAYASKGEDGTCHIIPSVSPENWGFTPDFRLNRDCIIDLALARFELDATVEASAILGLDEPERARWKEVSASLAPYPKAQGPSGEVWVDVVNAPAEVIYNVPCTLAPVFPGEQVGIGLREENMEIARRTARTVRLEGGNDLVYQPLIRARLGALDLDWFKREVRYCLLPNGVANDRVRQAGGRYKDSTDFDFMMPMGVWIENLSLPAVLNECLLQSYTGTIRLFPNTHGLGRARFENLRAAGAFLVSAAYDGKTVSGVKIFSEKGRPVRLANPWKKVGMQVTHARRKQSVPVRKEKDTVLFSSEPGELYRIEPA